MEMDDKWDIHPFMESFISLQLLKLKGEERPRQVTGIMCLWATSYNILQ